MGQLDPSSRESFLIPAIRVICSPTAVLPVKLIFRTRGAAHNAGPIHEPAPVIVCSPFIAWNRSCPPAASTERT